MPKQKDHQPESEYVPPWDEFHLFLEDLKPNLQKNGIQLFNHNVSATNTETNRSGSGIYFHREEYVMLMGAKNLKKEIGFTRLMIDIKATKLKARHTEWITQEDIFRGLNSDTASAIQKSGDIVYSKKYIWTKTI